MNKPYIKMTVNELFIKIGKLATENEILKKENEILKKENEELKNKLEREKIKYNVYITGGGKDGRIGPHMLKINAYDKNDLLENEWKKIIKENPWLDDRKIINIEEE